MSIPVPDAVQYHKVTWNLGHAKNGTTSLAGARGRVKFEATATAVAYSEATVLPAPVETPVIGGLMTPVDLLENTPGIWNWKVTPSVGVQWVPFHIDVEGPVNLASAATMPGAGPVRVIKGDRGAQGASLSTLEQINEDTLRAVIDDPLTGTSKTDYFTLPRGPEGPYGGTEVTDPQVASYILSPTETRDALDQRYGTVVKPEEYGAVGDGVTNDRDAIQLAINESNGKTLQFTSGREYVVSGGGLLVPDSVTNLAMGSSGAEAATLRFDVSSAGLTSSNEGLLAVTVDLTKSIGSGQYKWEVSSTDGIRPGMLCTVKSSESWYFDPRPQSTDARKSELHKVRSVDHSAKIVEFEDFANDGYNLDTETVELAFYEPRFFEMKNLVLRAPLPPPAPSVPRTFGVKLGYYDKPRLLNVTVDGFSENGIGIRHCYRPLIAGGETVRCNQFTGYGVQVVGCSYAIVRDRVFTQCRKAVDVSGFQIISTHTLVENCVTHGGGAASNGDPLGFTDTGGSGAGSHEQTGFGTHGPAAHTTFKSCTTVNIKRPYTLRGYNEAIIDLRHFGRAHTAVIVCEDGQNLYVDGGQATSKFWGALEYLQFMPPTEYRFHRPESLVAVKANYKAEPASGIRYGRMVIKNVSAELSDTVLKFLDGSSLPSGLVVMANNTIMFASTESSRVPSLVERDAGTFDSGVRFRWFLGPNQIIRDDRTSGHPLYETTLTSSVDLSGANVAGWTEAP